MELRSCRKTRASTNHYSDHIKLKFNKKMKTSTSSANAKLILHVNATTNKLERFNGTPLEPVPDLGRLKPYQFIHSEWFQDNSLLFDNLLTKKEDFILCIYPPGSGKSTTATLLYYYLSKNAKPPGEIQKWLNKCKFQEKEKEKSRENPSYTEFRRSSSFVMLMDFGRIRGDTRERLEKSYIDLVMFCWKRSGMPTEELEAEAKLLREDPGAIWSLLSRQNSIAGCVFDGSLYLILDGLDNIYNLIANLPAPDNVKVYTEFTGTMETMIRGARAYQSGMRIFAFGVSPYLISEFQTKCFFSIADEKTSIKEFFSYSDASINELIKKWELDVSLETCKSVAGFKYNSNEFVNPYLCVSFLNALRDKRTYSVNLSLHSLRMRWTFEEPDLEVLRHILKSQKYNCKFEMGVSMKTIYTIPEFSESLTLYYPLFVFGGFLSCTMEKNKTYTLSASNDTAKIVLNYHLESIQRNLKF